MANDKNLIPFSQRTEEEQREIRSKGGKASQKKQREKKALKQLMQDILEMPLNTGDIDTVTSIAELKGANITVEQAILYAQVKRAMKGDFNSFRAVIEIAELLKKDEPEEKEKDNSFINALNASAAEVWKDEK